jgi:hypothetical protein
VRTGRAHEKDRGRVTLSAWPQLAGKILIKAVPVVAAAVLTWLRRLSPAAPG